MLQDIKLFASDASTTLKTGGPFFVHGDRANCLSFAGNVETLSVAQHWDDGYFYTYDRGFPKSVLPARYFTANGDLISQTRD